MKRSCGLHGAEASRPMRMACCGPVEGPDSCEVTGIFAKGCLVRLPQVSVWPLESMRPAKMSASASMQWLSRQDSGKMGPGRLLVQFQHWLPGRRQARGWFFGRHQLNIPEKAGWSALKKGYGGTTAPDLWRNMPEEEWRRLTLLNVSQKCMKESGGDMCQSSCNQGGTHCTGS